MEEQGSLIKVYDHQQKDKAKDNPGKKVVLYKAQYFRKAVSTKLKQQKEAAYGLYKWNKLKDDIFCG